MNNIKLEILALTESLSSIFLGNGDSYEEKLYNIRELYWQSVQIFPVIFEP